jgi:Domain of unknown function (DUF4375)
VKPFCLFTFAKKITKNLKSINMKLKMTLQEFKDIEVYNAEEYLTSNHCSVLLNPYLSKFEENYPFFSTGQKVLYCISSLSGQVNNGGLFQFFFNKTDLIEDTFKAIQLLNEQELEKNFEKAYNLFVEKALNTLVKTSSYIRAKKRIDLEWFDSYFDEHTIELERNLLKYINNNPFEFIEIN